MKHCKLSTKFSKPQITTSTKSSSSSKSKTTPTPETKTLQFASHSPQFHYSNDIPNHSSNTKDFENTVDPEDTQHFEDSDLSDTEDVPPRPLSIDLLRKCHLSQTDRSNSDAQDVLMQLTHLYIDRLNLNDLSTLKDFRRLTHVYAQHNLLQSIPFLPESVIFLSFANNTITDIKNLTHLTNLQFLDLSNNKIQTFDNDELPLKLVVMRIKGNPCEMHPSLVEAVLAACPDLEVSLQISECITIWWI